MLSKKNKAFSIFYFIFGLILFTPAPSYANCTNPASPVGGISYDSAGDFMAVLACDGTDWVPWAGWTVTGYPAPQYSSGGGLSADAVLESHLKSVNAATDEYCLTYETTTGDFEWQACGGGGSSLWTAGTGDNIYYNSGTPKVGIGTNAPARTVDILTTDGDGLRVRENTGNAWIDLTFDTSDSDAYSQVYGQFGLKLKTERRIFYEAVGGNWSAAHIFKTTNDMVWPGGDTHFIDVDGTWAPTSGSGVFYGMYLRTAINQTGTANGDFAVLGLQPQLTSFQGTNALLIQGFDSAGTTTVFNVTAAGGGYFADKVGIGTNPSVALDVVGDINFTGQIVDVSDIRMKYDIAPLDSPLRKLTSLNGISFKMKGDPEKVVEYGVSAQDVQKVFPELVSVVDPEEGTLGVNYNGLIAPMIEAIKELQANNAVLTEQNAVLKVRIDALEKQQE